MKSFIKFLFPFLFFITLFVAVPKVSADVIIVPPGQGCEWNEVEVLCKTKKIDDCIEYRNNSDYYLYRSNDFGFNDDVISFCRKASFLDLLRKNLGKIIIPLIITITLELFIFILARYRTFKELFSVFIINFISLPIGYLLYPIIHLRVYYLRLNYSSVADGLMSLLIVETIIILIETIFLIYIAKFENKRKTIITVIIANIITGFLGLILSGLLQGL